MNDKLSHLGEDGRVRMVDVGDKAQTTRSARAAGLIRMKAETLETARTGNAKKGDVIAAAQLAGIMAAKRTGELIPLCHPLSLTGIDVEIAADETVPGFRVQARVRCFGPTGVEMEALTAVSVACLTLYDMLKAIDKTMSIEAIQVVEKQGGASGDFTRAEAC